jgi:hypothetical protein
MVVAFLQTNEIPRERSGNEPLYNVERRSRGDSSFLLRSLRFQSRLAAAFRFPGWWLYAKGSDHAILHVIHQNPLPNERTGVLDHWAVTAKDPPETVATLNRDGIDHELRRLPGGGIWQLFFHDPHGAKVEFDFDKDEPAPAGFTAS